MAVTSSDRTYNPYEYDYDTVWDSDQKAWMTTVAEYPELVAHGHSMQEAFYGAVDKVKTVIEEAYSQGTEPITPNRYLDFSAR